MRFKRLRSEVTASSYLPRTLANLSYDLKPRGPSFVSSTSFEYGKYLTVEYLAVFLVSRSRYSPDAQRPISSRRISTTERPTDRPATDRYFRNLGEFNTALIPAFNHAKRSTLSSEADRGPARVGGPDTCGPRTKSTVELGTERERGLRRKSRGPEGPSLGLRARYTGGEGLEGAKAHSKAERLPVKVEGTNSLSRYRAPFLSSSLPFFQRELVAGFHPSPWDRPPRRSPRRPRVPCRAVPCRAVPSRCYERRDATRAYSRNRINENSRWTRRRAA